MGCNASRDSSPGLRERRRNHGIDTSQRKAELASAAKIELLILGTGDSGKTTLRKQLANVHNRIFQDENHRKTYASTIIINLIEGVLQVLREMGPRFAEDKDAQVYLSNVASHLSPSVIDDDLALLLRRYIFQDDDFRRLSCRQGSSCTVQLQDCWFVFAKEFKDYPAWGGSGWIPSADDCVRSRVRTSGVIRDELKIDGLSFVIYDVGGQRAERRKWLHMFDSVLSCIYVAAISEYDQVLFEDRTKNRLEEALDLFAETINSPWFTEATTLLFLNKKDLFHEKFTIDRIPLNVSGKFPTAPCDNDDEEGTIQWIANQFIARKRWTAMKPSSNTGGKIYVHLTTATDPSNIKAVFRVSTETILGRCMQAVGLT
jgi:guanine nucleotide-binding protein subunit alpha